MRRSCRPLSPSLPWSSDSADHAHRWSLSTVSPASAARRFHSSAFQSLHDGVSNASSQATNLSIAAFAAITNSPGGCGSALPIRSSGIGCLLIPSISDLSLMRAAGCRLINSNSDWSATSTWSSGWYRSSNAAFASSTWFLNQSAENSTSPNQYARRPAAEGAVNLSRISDAVHGINSTACLSCDCASAFQRAACMDHCSHPVLPRPLASRRSVRSHGSATTYLTTVGCMVNVRATEASIWLQSMSLDRRKNFA